MRCVKVPHKIYGLGIMKQDLILYTFVRCPWAMRARLALAFMDIEYEAIEVDLKNKPQSLLDISPKGTVPVLLFPDGTILQESLDIILWAMPKPVASQQAEISEIIKVNDNEFKHSNHRYKYAERYVQDGKTQQDYRSECENYLKSLEQKLAQREYLICNEITIADLAVFPLIRQFAKVDERWFADAPYPNIQRWLETISNSNFYAKAMQKSK